MAHVVKAQINMAAKTKGAAGWGAIPKTSSAHVICIVPRARVRNVRGLSERRARKIPTAIYM